MPLYRHTFGSKLEKGKKKVHPEESIVISSIPQGQLFILSKGIGQKSELAARVMSIEVKHYIQSQTQPFSAKLLQEAFAHAQEKFNKMREDNKEDMGESAAYLAVLAIHENQLFCLSIGKNAVLLGNNQRLTALFSPADNDEEKVFLTEQPLLLNHGDILFLSSPSVVQYVPTNTLSEILFKDDYPTQTKAEKIVALSQEKNEEEGCSVIVVQHFEIAQQPNEPTENAIFAEKAAELDELESKLARFRRQTVIAFVVFVIFILMLYFNKTQRWENAIQKLDSLERITQQQQKKIQLLERQEKLRTENIRNYYFDSFDNDRYRLYGLLRDTEKKYKISEISTMFNIFNTNAIKVSEVMGEQWYIVPIKAVHFMQAGESATTLAQKYYTDLADSILIKKFNHQLVPYRHVFIPFNK
ncbi:MAG: hypothetical protein NZ521_02665 [Flammeovirgaceae bacterium]|nr:hypothetical protein [Flammeovirgaceae bacterium]MDW8287050.1 hypothetical protein [Flammeovirgaceae bacterium]